MNECIEQNNAQFWFKKYFNPLPAYKIKVSEF